MKSYIISFNPATLAQQDLLNYLDIYPYIILNWQSPFTGTILIVSNSTLKELSNIIAAKFTQQHFMISEVSSPSTDGRMNPFAWEFIKNPKSSGRSEYMSSSPLARLASGIYGTPSVTSDWGNGLGFSPQNTSSGLSAYNNTSSVWSGLSAHMSPPSALSRLSTHNTPPTSASSLGDLLGGTNKDKKK